MKAAEREKLNDLIRRWRAADYDCHGAMLDYYSGKADGYDAAADDLDHLLGRLK